jgi:nitroreductase
MSRQAATMERRMTRNDAALDFLSRRRSTPPKAIAGPAPDRAALDRILRLAVRSPDHGMLVPWRFVVLQAPALRRQGGALEAIGARQGLDPAQIAKGAAIYATSPLAVAVIASPKPGKIPDAEQHLSAGAACLSLLNAALASGWAAGWVTGWPAHDRGFVPALLNLAEAETIAGMIHIGTGATPPDRPRPDPAQITTWIEQ